MKFFLLLPLISLTVNVLGADRDTLAYYKGGHWNSVDLVLYNDSTFTYNELGAMMFSRAEYSGTYSLKDSILTLCTENNFAWLRKPEHKLRYKTWRFRGSNVLYFTEQQEADNPSYYREYYTLYRQ